MDKIIFTGRLGMCPEKKTSKAGKDYCRLNVAITHYEGEGQKSTEWRQVTVFGKTGEYCVNVLKKGDNVTIEGYPQPRAYMPKSGGEPVGVIDVRAETVDGVHSGSDSGNSTNTHGGMTDVTGSVEEELPF